MILELVKNDALLRDMNKGLITLIHKGGLSDELSNYQPITLLNISYKVLAKALQKWLQPLLPDLIDEDQTAF